MLHSDIGRSTWFITGINRGLGRHLVEQLLRQGAKVFGTTRHLDQLIDLQQAYPNTLYIASLDLANSSDIKAVVENAFNLLGHIDIIVSNAGYGLVAAVEETTEDDIKHQLETNLIGSILVARYSIPFLRNQGGGRLIQISSSVGQSSIPGVSLYVASKWGIEGFYESLVDELSPFSIEITLVEPGGIRTGFASQAKMPEALNVYKNTPAGEVRKFVMGGYPDAPGDPSRMASLIIGSLQQSPAPFRMVLGSDSYISIKKSLEDRLIQIKKQSKQARLSDFTTEELQS